MSELKWYFTSDQILNSPSRRDGIDTDREAYCRQGAAKLIQEMGQRLQVTQLVINTAVVYVHRFYMFHSFSRFQRHLIAPAALFLAAKIEEQPRKLELVIKISHFIQERANLDIKSQVYVEKVQQMIYHENVILQTLGFELAIDHPHTYVVNFFQSMRTKPLQLNEYAPQASESDLAKKAYYVATNSLHLTTLCLQYRPSLVACVCIYLVCKWNNYEQINFTDGYQVIDPNCTMKMVENVASVLEKHQQFMKKLSNTVGTGPNANNLEDENSSKISKPTSDTSNIVVTNHNNNVDKNCTVKEILPATSSTSKTVLTPKEYLDKKIKERISRESFSHEQHQAKHKISSTADNHGSIVKINSSHNFDKLQHENHNLAKLQLENDPLTISNHKSSKSFLDANQNAAKNHSELTYKLDSSESVHKTHKIHSECRHKVHKSNYLTSNKASKVHSDSAHKFSKDHRDSLNNARNINYDNSHKLAKVQFNSNMKTSSLIELGHKEFKVLSDNKTSKPIPESTHKIIKSHFEPDNLAYKFNSLSTDLGTAFNTNINLESTHNVQNVCSASDIKTLKSNLEPAYKISKTFLDRDNMMSRVSDSNSKTVPTNFDKMSRSNSELTNKTTKEQLEFNNNSSDINLVTMHSTHQVQRDSCNVNSKLNTLSVAGTSIEDLNCGNKIKTFNPASDQFSHKVPSDSSFKIPKIRKNSTNEVLKVSSESAYKIPKIKMQSSHKDYKVSSDSKNNISKINLEAGYRKFILKSECESKIANGHIASNLISPVASANKVCEVRSEPNEIKTPKVDVTDVATIASMIKSNLDQKTLKIPSNSGEKMAKINSGLDNIAKMHHDHNINIKSAVINKINKAETSMNENNLNSVEKLHDSNVETRLHCSDIHSSSNQPLVKRSSEMSFLDADSKHTKMIDAEPKLMKMDQNTGLKGLIKKMHSENSHKIRKSNSRSSHKSHRVYSEKDKNDLPHVSSISALQLNSHKTQSYDFQISQPHHASIELGVSAESKNSKIVEPTKVYSSQIDDPMLLKREIVSVEHPAYTENLVYKKSNYRTSFDSNKNSEIGKDINISSNSKIPNINSSHDVNLVRKINDCLQKVASKSRLGLNDDSSVISERTMTESEASRNMLRVPKLEHGENMNVWVKDEKVCKSEINGQVEIKKDLSLKEENKELVSFKAFNFNSDFSLRDVLKPSEKPPEDIFDTETDFKLTPSLTVPLNSVNNVSSEVHKSEPPPPREFLKPEHPPRLESQPVKSNRSTPIYSLLPTVQQSLYRYKNIGNDSSMVPKNASAFTVSADKDPPMTTEQVHAYYKEIEARKLEESRQDGFSENRSSNPTFLAESSGTSKKREHKHKKHKKDRHGDKEHKKSKKSKSKKHKKEKHRERVKGEEPLPSIKISVFNNLYVPNSESLPSQSDSKQNTGNASTEKSRIKLTIPFSRIHSNITPTSLEIQSHAEIAPKIKLKIPKEGQKKASKRSRDSSPDNQLYCPKRARRSSSLTNLHNTDFTAKLSKHIHNSDSPQAQTYRATDSSYSNASQDQSNIQIRHFSCIS